MMAPFWSAVASAARHRFPLLCHQLFLFGLHPSGFKPQVQHIRINISAVGPDYGAGSMIYADLTKHFGVLTDRLENGAAQVRLQINLSTASVCKTKSNSDTI